MHELGLTQQIVDVAVEKGQQAGAKRIVSVRVKAGEMAEVAPDSLRFYFASLARGTIAEGAELVIEIVPLLAECSDCHSRFAPADSHLKCPECGSRKIEIVEGREAYVESVDVE